MSGILSNIPEGLYRVVEILLESGTDMPLGDFSPEKAILIADQHNSSRVGLLDSVYWIYNSSGELIQTHHPA